MLKDVSHKLLELSREAAAFFVPRKFNLNIDPSLIKKKTTAIMIPTYVPTTLTYNLITSLIKWHPKALIVVIDDCTPLNKKTTPTINKIKELASTNKNVVYLRTPQNTLKAGALNYGIQFLINLKQKPDAVFTLDDDVAVNEETIPNMIAALFADEKIGAVCSQIRVRNKNKNVLTRLQSLEYHNFNITKTADNGFLRGPLVMQGSLSAFRLNVLQELNGYSEGHLIEDYDITARLKERGWKVAIALNAIGWTTVPETIEALWKQRVRWTTGGLQVLGQFWKNVIVIYQDVIGHVFFLTLSALILLSFFLTETDTSYSPVGLILLGLAFVNFILAFTFNLFTLFVYPQRDKKDWALKAAIFPEFIYSNILSLILIGSYLFIVYKSLSKSTISKNTLTNKPYQWGLAAFKKAGFSSTWGTR